jgi:hypothetical protein
MRKLMPGILALLCLCASPAVAEGINHVRIARAEEIIKKYVSEKYAWNESLYEIYIDSKKSLENTVCFAVRRRDDEHPPSAGRGKSFLVVFDMKKMNVRREMSWQ